MPKIIVHHEVEDTEHWLNAGKATRAGVFGDLKATNIQEFTNPENPSQVGLSMEIPDLDALAAFMSTPEAAEAMRKDGVKGDTVVILVEA
jgi:hypothetical protein